MSEDKSSGSGKAQGGAAPSFADVATGIIDDCLSNIIHEIVLSTHREEKLQRMQSAATIAEQAAIQEVHDNAEKSKIASAQPPSVKIDTPAAVYDNGRVTLRGNPLKTTPEIICPCCKLPRLMYPIAGAGAQMPDLSKNYCNRHPFVSRAGHDIYNNPFPTDMAKTKKERELIKRQEKDNTPGSQDTEAAESSLSKLAAGGKPASYIPWHTCPNCKRSLLITRFAQHAEKCLGISGRQSSRNAMAKLNNHGTGSANTPLGSRVGTPVPSGSNLGNSSQGGGGGGAGGKISPVKKNTNHDGEGDHDEDATPTVDTTPKKVKKKSSYVKKADREKAAAAATAAIGGNDSPKSNTTPSSSSNLKPNANKDAPQHRPGTKILKLKAPSAAAAAAAAAAGGKRPPKDDGKAKASKDKEKDKDKDRERDKERHGTPSSQLLNSNNKRERERERDRERERQNKKQEREREREKDSDDQASGGDSSDSDDDDGAPLKKKIRLVKQESAGSVGLGGGFGVGAGKGINEEGDGKSED